MSKRSLFLVIIQFSCFVYFLFSGRFIANNIWFVVQIIGFTISLWGVFAMKLGNFNIQPEVKADAQFVSNGPYSIMRNPMYTGLVLFFGASVVSSYSSINLSVFTVLVIVLVEKIKLEEKFLAAKFGDLYLKYKEKTYRLIPLIF